MKNEDILALIHRVTGFARRTPPPQPENCTPPSREAIRACRERGRILVELEKLGDVTQKQLACALDIRPQSLSELLLKLESDGMIERCTCDSDKRASIVTLSAKGREHIDAVKAERRHFADEFLSPLSEEEKNTLAALLTKLLEAKKEPRE